MVIWLRQAHLELTDRDAEPLAGIGVEDEVLRREALATAVALDDAYQETHRQQEAIIAAAHERVAARVAQTETEIETLREAARREYESAKQRGYQAGYEQA